MQSRAVIVIPTYNEASNVPELFARVTAAAPEADIMVVDDGSPDGTADLAERALTDRLGAGRFQVVRRTGPRGLGRAYREGFAIALERGFDRIVQMDADLSHDPAHLPALLEASRTADLVIGSRYCPGGRVENWPGRRILLSRFAVWYVQRVASVPVADATAGYRCWTRSALQAVEIETLHSEGYSFQVEMCHRAVQAGLRSAEIPIVFTDRQFGRSKISRTVLIESFLLPWRLRLRPWRARAAQPAAEAVNG